MVLLSIPAGSFAAASPPTAPHQAPPDSAVPKPLLVLRGQLISSDRAQVKSDLGHFRALCDDEGYPLVGNIANKGGRFQPSELCAELRAAPKK